MVSGRSEYASSYIVRVVQVESESKLVMDKEKALKVYVLSGINAAKKTVVNLMVSPYYQSH